MRFTKEGSTILKVLLPFLIILHHLSFKIEDLSLFSNWGVFIVSLFFFMSGYGLVYSFHNKNNYLNDFFAKRIFPVIVPFLICVCIYQLYILVEGSLSFNLGISDLLLRGDTNGILPASWFVFEIIIVYLVFLGVYSAIGEKSDAEWIFIGLIIAIVGLLFIMGYGAWWAISIGGFALGVVFAKYSKHITYFALTIISIVSLVPLFILGDGFISLFVKTTILPIPVIAILSSLNGTIVKTSRFFVVQFLSSISYELYLTHVIVYRFLRSSVIYVQSDCLYITTTILGSIILSLLVLKLSKYINIIPQKKLWIK